jgi:phage-related protein
MAFFGSYFIYDGIPSETYGLKIMDIDSQEVSKSMGSSSMEILEQKIFRRAQPYFYGATPAPKLDFAFSAFAENEMDAEMFQLVQKWLFSSRSYKKLQIDQADIRDIYFDCILTDPTIVRVGNLIQGFSCQVQCNSPFAWKFPSTINYTYTSSIVDDSVVYFNGSDDTGGYLYPHLVITMNNLGGDVSITNSSDSSRVFSFTGLSAGEVITVDCSNQTISSSLGLKRLSNFNKKFLRLIPAVNNLRIQGNVANIAMTTQYIAKKLGG